MSHSHAEYPQLVCNQCGLAFTTELWLIVDAAERLDLLARVMNGTIHAVACPNGHAGGLNAPLLLYLPDEDPSLIYSPAQMTDEPDAVVAVWLLVELREALGDEWRVEWEENDPPVIARDVLPLFLAYRAAEAERRVYDETGALSALDKAINLWELIIQESRLSSAPVQFQVGVFTNAALTYRRRSQASNSVADLDRAMDLLSEAKKRDTSHSPQGWVVMHNMGNVLGDKFARSKRIEDLEDAIANYRLALESVIDPLDRSHVLYRLGHCLVTLFERTGRMEWIDEAIITLQAALSDMKKDFPLYAFELNMLGQAYKRRYIRLKNWSDLMLADGYCSYAVEKTLSEDPEFAHRLSNLASVKMERYEFLGALTDLDEAMDKGETVLRALPENSPSRGFHLHRSARYHAAWYRATGEMHHLNRAVDFLEKAITLHPENSPARAEGAMALSSNLDKRFLSTGREEDLLRASQLARAACLESVEINPATTLLAAGLWATISLRRGQWAEALEALDHGQVALQKLLLATNIVAERISWLSEASGIAAIAAYASAKLGDLEAAVVALERGQAQALNGALALQRDSLLRDRLRGEHPALFARFREADKGWRACQMSYPPDAQLTMGVELTARAAELRDHRQRTDAAWTALNTIVDEINTLPGYETFHAPATFADVTAVVEPKCPLVYMVTTSAGTLMLLIHATGGAARVEGLWADLSKQDLDRLLFRRADPAGNVGKIVGGLLPWQEKGGPLFSSELAGVLDILGQQLMVPLAARLRVLGVHQVTLVPGGRLNLLPLHAATYSVPEGSGTFLDEFTVTYVPSANAAAVSRARADTCNSLGIDALIVGDTLMEKPLLFARQEAELVTALFLGRATLLLEADATHDVVWEAMHNKNALHFACHGIYEPRIPRRAGLAMADGRLLSLNGIRTANLLGVRLVTLSACQTALTHFRDLPDEVIGLPAAFLEAGAAGVVGSLWPVDDGSTMLLMEQFYRRLLVGIAPAEALRQAQRALRTMTRQQVSEYFKAHLSTDTDWARIGHERLPAGKPHTCIYADPYHWAGFTFTGG